MSLQVDSLISYVKRIKPFHTKILGVEVSYIVNDTVSVTFTESLSIDIKMGIPAEYYLPAGSLWDAEGFDANGFDSSWPKPRANSYTPVDTINVPNGAKWDGLSYDMSEWDPYFDPAYELQNGIYPLIDGVGTGMVDGVHVTFHEKLDLHLSMYDLDTPKPTYVQSADAWDSDGSKILAYGSNWIEIKGDWLAIFNSQPLMVFNVSMGSLAGTYTCINVQLQPNGNTKITTAENVQRASSSVHFGIVDVSSWDNQGWDNSVFTQIPSDRSTFPIGTSFFERFTVTEGLGWDQDEWDNTSGTYTGSTALDYYDPDKWSIPGKWDDSVNIIDSHNININNAYPMDGDDDIEQVGFMAYVSSSVPRNARKIAILDADGATSARMTEVHVQTTASTIWSFDDVLNGSGSFIVYNETGLQIPWVTCSISAGYRVVIQFATPQRGYVLGE